MSPNLIPLNQGRLPLGEIIDFFLEKIRNFTSLKSHFAVLYSVFKVHPSFGRLPASLARCGVHLPDSTIEVVILAQLAPRRARFARIASRALHKVLGYPAHWITSGGLKWTRTIDLSVISRVL